MPVMTRTRKKKTTAPARPWEGRVLPDDTTRCAHDLIACRPCGTMPPAANRFYPPKDPTMPRWREKAAAELLVFPNRADRRAARPSRPRPIRVPHPLGVLQRVRPAEAQRRAAVAERLHKAWTAAKEAGIEWVTPEMESDDRAMRAARRRGRQGRAAAQRARRR